MLSDKRKKKPTMSNTIRFLNVPFGAAADGSAKMLHVIPGLLFQRLKSDRRYSAVSESRYRVERRELRAKFGALGAF